MKLLLLSLQNYLFAVFLKLKACIMHEHAIISCTDFSDSFTGNNTKKFGFVN